MSRYGISPIDPSQLETRLIHHVVFESLTHTQLPRVQSFVPATWTYGRAVGYYFGHVTCFSTKTLPTSIGYSLVASEQHTQSMIGKQGSTNAPPSPQLCPQSLSNNMAYTILPIAKPSLDS